MSKIKSIKLLLLLLWLDLSGLNRLSLGQISALLRPRKESYIAIFNLKWPDSDLILGNILYTIYDGDDGAIFTEKPLITTQPCTWFFLSKMASVVGCLLVIGFFQGSVLGEQQQNTLNVPQVLLPYAPRGSVHTNFTLKALQGCYLW